VPRNTTELLEQWTEAHGIDRDPDQTREVAGYPYEAYEDAEGQVLVERYEIEGAGHATFVDPSSGCGTASAFIADEGICTVGRLARFFGIGDGGHEDLDAGVDGGPDARPDPDASAPRDAATVVDGALRDGGARCETDTCPGADAAALDDAGATPDAMAPATGDASGCATLGMPSVGGAASGVVPLIVGAAVLAGLRGRRRRR
jgi:hypothetical protein